MKYPGKSLLVIVAVVVLPLAAINIFLFFGLTGIAKKKLPEIKKATGLSVDFNEAWATLPAGRVNITGLKVGNPDGFSADDATFLSIDKTHINIAMLSLPLGIIKLSQVDIKKSKLTVVKNAAAKINAVAIGDIARASAQGPQTQTVSAKTGDQPRQSADTHEGKPAEAPAGTLRRAIPPAPAPARKVVVGNADIDTIVEYIDRKASPDGAAKLALALKITAKNIANFGSQEKENGSFSIKGHIDGKPDSLVIDIRGATTPLHDTKTPSFTVTGSVTNICTTDFKKLAAALGIESECINISLNINCREGSFERGMSVINVNIRNLRLTGPAAGQARDMSMSNLSVCIPLKGTLDAPDIDLIGALTGTLPENLGSIIKSINIDQKNISKQINNCLDGIFGGKKKK